MAGTDIPAQPGKAVGGDEVGALSAAPKQAYTRALIASWPDIAGRPG